MRMKCFAHGHNILVSGFAPSTSVSRNRHSNHIHVGSFNKQPCFTKFITTLLTYVLHLIYNMQTISQAELITPCSIATITPYRLMPINLIFSPCMNIWNHLPCSAVSHVIPSVDNFHKFAMPAIKVMQPLCGTAIIYYVIYDIL